ncbi:MAG: ABC transporter substrate-binding protein, partial [Verrucomicrobiota bacterium]
TILEKDIKKGRSLTQTRIEDWWADDKKFWKNRFNPDKRRFVVVRDLNKMLESFKRGDFDMLRIRTPENWGPKLDIPEVKNGYIHRAQFYNQVPRPTYAMRINQTKPLLDNRDIRIGIHHASNWDLILKEIFKGDYTRMRTTSDGYGEFTHPTLQARPFSVEEATASFANAGFDQRGPDGILVNADGKKLSFTLTTGYKRLEDALSILVEEAKKAGLELKLEVLDSTAGWKKAQEKKHELMFTALNTAVEMYPRFFDFYHSYNAFDEMGKVKANTNNMTVTANPELDKMIEAYEKSQDLEEIKRLSHQIQEQVHEAGAYVPGFVRPFFRCAYWNWVQWPEGFSTRLSREHDEYDVHWIDEDLKTETMKARKESRALPQAPVIYDQHKNS